MIHPVLHLRVRQREEIAKSLAGRQQLLRLLSMNSQINRPTEAEIRRWLGEVLS